MVIHDDVLLNPALNERNFRDTFPLGPDDGFYPSLMPLPASHTHSAAQVTRTARSACTSRH